MRFPAVDAFNKCQSYFTTEEFRNIILLGSGGCGKSYYALTKLLYDAIVYDKPFGIAYESRNIISALCANKGADFFKGLVLGWEKHKTKVDANMGKWAKAMILSEDSEVTVGSGAVKYKEKIICKMASYNDASLLKGGNAVINRMLIDEFIPEKVTFRNSDIDVKITSLLETQGRDRLELLVMLANPIRLKTPVLNKLGISDIKPGQTKVLYKRDIDGNYEYKINNDNSVSKSVFTVAHYIDFSKNLGFQQFKQNTLASQFAIATGNTYRLVGGQAGITGEDIVEIRDIKKHRPIQIIRLRNMCICLYNINTYLHCKEIEERYARTSNCITLTPFKQLINSKTYFDAKCLNILSEGVQGGYITYQDENTKLGVKDALKII